MTRTGLLLLCAALAAPCLAAGPVRRPSAALVLEDRTPATRREAIRGVAALGGRVLHTFDGVLVVDLPRGAERRAARISGVASVEGLPSGARLPRRAAPVYGLAAWDAIARDAWPTRVGAAPGAPLAGDALAPPAGDLDAVRKARRAAALGGAMSLSRVAADTTGGGPFGATDLNTSEFLAGSLSVNIVLPESDGAIDASTENWSSDRENQVVAEIAAGLEWVRLQEPQANLSFVYHVYAGRTDPRARTSYEPIRRAADPMGTTGEDLWVKEILGKLGYVSGDRFTRVRAFDADTRAADGTDWAVTVFVADSLADTDGRFADGRFAYTWIGGPHVIMTYDNQAWGIDRMDMVLRHELMHAFWAFDEYATSGCTCTEHRGYLDGVDTNCNACNPVADACVMIANGDAMCAATRRQIGWADLDGDGVIDVVGEDPDTFPDALPETVCGPVTFAGLATVVAATNRNPATSTPRSNISIATISGVDVRVDGGTWQPAGAESGEWGVPQERFTTAFPSLPAGGHVLEARARDDYGNVDLSPGQVSVTVAPTAAPMTAALSAWRSSGGGAQLSWTASSGAQRYRVYRAPAPTGPWSLVAETTGTTWGDVAGSTGGYYRVRAVDACGDEQD